MVLNLLSIHAPTRGATMFPHKGDMICIFFQSTLLQEERPCRMYFSWSDYFFQSTLLQEERHNSILWKHLKYHFQSTLLQEERHWLSGKQPPLTDFQSTLLQEERPEWAKQYALSDNFQSTLLQEERPFWYERRKSTWSFNPRSYKRSDHITLQFRDKTILSIHAPTRGATKLYELKTQIWNLSIHAPTRGATWQHSTLLPLQDFQSTLLQEERPHAKAQPDSAKAFNPRSYKRSDISICILIHATLIFQSTLLQEERLHTDNTYRCIILLSIHAPTRGATKRCPCEYAVFWLSIHAPTRGATKYPCFLHADNFLSIHAPTRGATYW